jgi:hypothetical protein
LKQFVFATFAYFAIESFKTLNRKGRKVREENGFGLANFVLSRRPLRTLRLKAFPKT